MIVKTNRCFKGDCWLYLQCLSSPTRADEVFSVVNINMLCWMLPWEDVGFARIILKWTRLVWLK